MQNLDSTMDAIHLKTLYFKTERSGSQAEPLEIFYKTQSEVTLRMTDSILNMVTILPINTCRTQGCLCTWHTFFSVCRDPAFTCVFFLARKISKFPLSFLLDHLPKPRRTVSFPSSSPPSLIPLNWVLTLSTICTGQHGLKKHKLAKLHQKQQR